MLENQRLETEKSRAETAFNYAKDGLEKHGEKYETIIRKLSMQIKTNGIGATIAFHFSKSETKNGADNAHKKNGVDNAHKYVLNQLREWLKDFVTANTVEEFSLNIVRLSPAETRAATNEALALLNWLRRFTDGLASNQREKIKPNEVENQDA